MKTAGKWKSIPMKKIIESLGPALSQEEIISLKSDLKKNADASLVASGKIIRLFLEKVDLAGK
jgi:hypothetical protein